MRGILQWLGLSVSPSDIWYPGNFLFSSFDERFSAEVCPVWLLIHLVKFLGFSPQVSAIQSSVRAIEIKLHFSSLLGLVTSVQQQLSQGSKPLTQAHLSQLRQQQQTILKPNALHPRQILTQKIPFTVSRVLCTFDS